VLDVPVTMALNDCCWPGPSVTLSGETLTAIEAEGSGMCSAAITCPFIRMNSVAG